jgi:hypothetical protein
MTDQTETHGASSIPFFQADIRRTILLDNPRALRRMHQVKPTATSKRSITVIRQRIKMSRSMLGLWFVAFELQSAASAAPIPEHWTQFRGPHQNGSLDVDSIPLVWSTDSNILWKAEVEGGGNSSPVIWGDKLFLTSATIEGGGVKETAVMALERRSGKRLWRTSIPIMSLPGKTPSSENGWATPTPACDSTNLVVVFATGTIACLDHDGRLRWNQDLGPLQHLWGLAASPVLDASHVYYSVDQGSLCGQPSHLTAIDVRSGQTACRTNLTPSVGRGYSTPLLGSQQWIESRHNGSRRPTRQRTTGK